ncbi:cache domain-containing sensor histidine kinase [Paenibacillus protaetiae]|uniref:histidine kinase n=1 Tax=Paenibacillus protaetiae TaxID=2509456 RepID=A0A4P6EY50_9BACL|nr:sensor histidine kinase [Paenibacillus protaetiae]QAY68012.1 sensor histidine kinase [Paenibacillus protaetiae]
MIKRWFFSLQNKFMIFSLLIVLIPLIFVSGFSYIQSTRIIEKKVSLSNLKTVQQIGENINFFLSDMSNSALSLWQNKEFMKYFMLSYSQVAGSRNYLLSAQNALNSFAVFHTNIYSIYVKGMNGLEFDSASSTNTITPELQKQMFALRGEGIWIADEIMQYNHTPLKVISYIKVLKNIDKISADLALIKINVDEQEISDIYRDKLLSGSSDYFIIDEHKQIISSLDKSRIGTTLDSKYDDRRLYQQNSGYFKASLDGNPYIETYYNLSRPGWKLVNLVPMNELSSDTKMIRNVTVYAVLGSFILCLLMIILFSYKVLSPLNRVRRSMKALESENFSVVLPVKGNDEIAMISRSFNRMSRRLGELINEVYAGQLKQKEAELKALQAQINPHFLYNTLDTIYWMARMEKAYESSKLVQALSKLFRLSLNSGNEQTTVASEVEHLKSYILIQEKRFEDSIRFEIQAEPEAMACKTVKLVLQPLVENAIHHGIEKKGKHGTVRITISREGEELVYRITDDGAGADEAEITALLQQIKDGNRGFGIKNVNDRIHLICGQEYGLSFQTSPGSGMTVIVRQPFHIGG